MKNTFFQWPKDLLLHALIALSAGFGGTWVLCSALSLTVSLPFVFALCAAVVLGLAIMDCMPKLRPLFWLLALAALAFIGVKYAHRLEAIGRALTLFASGQPLALAAYSRAAAVLIGLFLTLLAAAFARSGYALFPLALLCVIMLLTVSFLGVPVPPAALLPLLFALLLSAKDPSVPTSRAIALAALILTGVALLIPRAGEKNEPFAAFAEKAKQAISDYLFFTDARTTFSLSSTGWQPLGPDRLGGPVSPTDDPVMQVYTTGRTLLRGTVKNTYTGKTWSDTTDPRRYLFVNPRFFSLRRDLFDQLRPKAEIRDSVLAAEPMIVSMRAPSASTLYLTQRFTSPTGEGIVAYFSPSTEVFATRSLEPASRYTFTGSRLSGASEGARRAVLASQSENDPYLPTIRERYLALPDGIDEQVLLLAQQIVQRAENDFDRAAALCTFLQRNYPYTLAQNMPPENRDYVSWFLLDEQQGYCTAFATALAVMGRAVGLPTRYVEGYAAEPDADNIARVTQEHAHAWVEVYFSGFGWLPFDPTPGTGFLSDGMQSDDGQEDGEENPPGESDDPQGGNSPDPNGADSPEPTPTATPTPTPAPTPTPSPTPQHSDPNVTPTPEITPVPTPNPTQMPTPESSAPPEPPKDENRPPAKAFLFLLALLLLILLVALRLYMCAPARIALRLRKSNDQVLLWYRVCAEALLCLGIPEIAGEGPASYLERAHHVLGGSPDLLTLGKAVCIARYSPHRIARTQAAKAEGTYRALVKRMKPAQLLRLYMRRIVHGIKL